MNKANTLEFGKCHLIECIKAIRLLEPKSVNLFFIDPPYFRIKGDFDFKLTFEQWQELHENLAKEIKRVLTDNGCILLYGHAKRIAYQQVIFDKWFNLENVLKWEKIECQTKRQDFEQSRCFAPVTEHILFYSNDWDVNSLCEIEKEYIAPRNPFAIEIKQARLKKGVSINAVAEYGKFYGNVNHGGAVTNWERGYNVPKEDQWKILCENLPIARTKYSELRQEYEHLRRPFNNANKLTDVLKFSQEAHITKEYDHETKKPEGLTTELLKVVTRKGDKVCIPFSGSGTESAMCEKLGLDWISFETNPKHVKTTNKRVNKIRDIKDPNILSTPIKDETDYNNIGIFKK